MELTTVTSLLGLIDSAQLRRSIEWEHWSQPPLVPRLPGGGRPGVSTAYLGGLYGHTDTWQPAAPMNSWICASMSRLRLR